MFDLYIIQVYKINILQVYTMIFHVNFFIQNKKSKNLVGFEHIQVVKRKKVK